MDILKSSKDFRRLSRSGKRWTSPAFIMQLMKRDEETSDKEGAAFRLGLTVSRRVGKAVVRNRVKRRLRAMVRLCEASKEAKGFDMVLIGRTRGAEYDFALMKQDFIKGLTKLKEIK